MKIIKNIKGNIIIDLGMIDKYYLSGYVVDNLTNILEFENIYI